MKKFFQSVKTYVSEHKKGVIIAGSVVGAVLLVGLIVALFLYNYKPTVTYQPIVACDLLTSEEASDLLGEAAVNSINNKPQIDGNLAVSRCGYTDRTVRDMKVAAIVVRSGVNDNGVEQNKTEFTDGMPTETIEIIKDLGDAAYFNEANRQLNILKDRHWIVATFGHGNDPLSNTREDALSLGQKLVN